MPSMKSANPISQNSPSALKVYLLAGRPKTWIASLAPVFIGASMAPHINAKTFLLTLLFSLLIQVGTNYANDYFDFIKGADTSIRKGPKRATQEGWITPQAMLRACLCVFSFAILIAIPLMMLAGFWSFILAGACVLFGFLYTGGPKPLGYLGLGELLVFPFFGPVATCGTYFLQTGTITLPVFFASLAPGFLSCALLIANNLRDEKSDRAAKKWTLIARFGKTFGAIEYTLAVLFAASSPFILVFGFGANINLLSSSMIAILAIPDIKKVFSFQDPMELIAVLQQSSLLLFFYTAFFCYFSW